MKKILIRAGILPEEKVSHIDILKNDLMWSNPGNRLFSDSIIKTLQIGNVEFTKIGDKNRYNMDVIQINEEYECFIIPLANAFRKDFNLKPLTEFIRALKIPCIVVGVGFQGAANMNFDRSFPFDEDAKNFCYAVLEKSASIGVRGEITYDYLTKHLGIPRHNVDIIGCPGMYMFGETLPQKNTFALNLEKISTNSIRGQENHISAFLNEIWLKYPKSAFVYQKTEEGRFLEYDSILPPISDKNYPNSNTHFLYTQKRLRFFTQTSDWLSFLHEKDYSIGARIHGNIAAILAGIPATVIAIDSRILELCRYHEIPFINTTELKPDTRVEDLYARSKDEILKTYSRHKENFKRYIQFLEKNGLQNIYSKSKAKDTSLIVSEKKDFPNWQYINSFGGIQKKFGGITRVVFARAGEIAQENRPYTIVNCKTELGYRDNFLFCKKNGFSLENVDVDMFAEYIGNRCVPIIGQETLFQITAQYDKKTHFSESEIKGNMETVTFYLDGYIVCRKYYSTNKLIKAEIFSKGRIIETYNYYQERLWRSSGKSVQIGTESFRHMRFFNQKGMCFLSADYYNEKRSYRNIKLYGYVRNEVLKFDSYKELSNWFLAQYVTISLEKDKTKKICFFNDQFLREYSGESYACLIENERLFKIGILHSPGIDRPIQSWKKAKYYPAIQNTYAGSCPYDALVFLTEEAKHMTELRFGRRSCNFVIPNFIDIPETIPTFSERDKKLAIFIGRLEMPQKRVLELISAFSIVVATIPDAKLEFWGDGTAAEIMKLEIERLNLSENVTLQGYSPTAKLRAKDALINIHPSEYEGFSLSLLESMAFGSIPIVYDYKFGVRDAIDEGISGFIVPISDIQALADKIIHAFKKAEQLEKMSINAYNNVKKYSKSEHFRKWKEVFTQIQMNKKYRNKITTATFNLGNIESKNEKISIRGHLKFTGFLPDESIGRENIYCRVYSDLEEDFYIEQIEGNYIGNMTFEISGDILKKSSKNKITVCFELENYFVEKVIHINL